MYGVAAAALREKNEMENKIFLSVRDRKPAVGDNIVFDRLDFCVIRQLKGF